MADPQAVAWLLKALCYKLEGRGFDSWWGQLTQYFQPQYGPGVDSASNRNEYWESSWELKDADHLTAICEPIV
jgi:hypothetical protein